jgi:CheY-like chemotaxis protein
MVISMPVASHEKENGMHEAVNARGRTVLVVDDEEMLVELVCRMVQRRGFETVTATSGADALALFDQHAGSIDLVITDLMMPDMDGKDLSAELLRRKPSLRILVSTGYSAPSDLNDIQSLGIKGVVTKPYQSDQLLAMVDLALDN